MKWTHGGRELDELLEHANSIHSSIKLTHEVSKTKISSLDATTTVKEGNMTTDLYSKPTDKHQYLSPSSCHPKHCFKSIPFSQAIRVKRIRSTVETTKQRLGDLRHHLKKRGYNDKVIESGFSKASEINRKWPTVDEGLDTAALTSVSLMLLGRRNATTGGSGNNLASLSLFSISFQ
jgi:hypothetical protein